MRRTSAAKPLDDDVVAALHTALNHLGAALWARCAGTAETRASHALRYGDLWRGRFR